MYANFLWNQFPPNAVHAKYNTFLVLLNITSYFWIIFALFENPK